MTTKGVNQKIEKDTFALCDSDSDDQEDLFVHGGLEMQSFSRKFSCNKLSSSVLHGPLILHAGRGSNAAC